MKQRRSGDGPAWVAIAALVCAVVAIELFRPMAIAPLGLVNLAVATVALGAAAIFYRRVRINLVALATIAATPVDGGHYFVDVIAGIAIVIASLFAARRDLRQDTRPDDQGIAIPPFT